MRLFQVGSTPEGRSVIRGAFKYVNEHGIPLDVLLSVLEKNNSVIDWSDFLEEAVSTGWNLNTIVTRVTEAVSDSYDRDSGDEIIKRIKLTLLKLIDEAD